MSPGVVARLRDFVPIRALTRQEALRIAELQASRFLELVGVTSGPVPEKVVAELPRVQVERLSPFPVSGATNWSNGRWLVILNGAEPITRQRFSLAHELKHILDHRFVAHLYRGVNDTDRPAWIEQVCDYFAGCLLMPRPWVKRAYASGIQRPPDLAAAFGVSQIAIRVRLNQIGLTEPQPRCGRPGKDWALRAFKSAGSSTRYQRTPTLVTIP